MPDIFNYEAFELTRPLSPYICDGRGNFYLCECEGKYYILHDPFYHAYRIERPKELRGIVQALPDLEKVYGATLSYMTTPPKELVDALSLTKVAFDDSKS